jgi:UDP-GlcNAc3NAcA epimerase
MKVLTVIGNRPQFIKAAAVSPRLRERHQELLIHTGQHFDDDLSAVFFAELGLPAPDRQLAIALGSNSSQTARMLAALEPVVAEEGVAVAHVEAGMRSFDRSMPEELNRVLTDHAASLLLCSSEVSVENLRREGVAGTVEMVGDVMVDVALEMQPRLRERTDLVAARGVAPGEYILATAHRAGNVDDPARLAMLVGVLRAMPLQTVFAVHPRTRARLSAAGLLEQLERSDNIVLTRPLGYVELTALLCNARAVLTDSGGLQKEAYLAGVPCITLRRGTEWTETVELGWNALVDLDAGAALRALEREPPRERPPLYGDGRAGERVVSALTQLVR